MLTVSGYKDYSKIFNVREISDKFNIDDKDQLISSYICSLQNEILLQGRLFIFQKKICFHSVFSFGSLSKDTLIKLDVEEVLKIEKVSNNILLETKKNDKKENQYKFTQFTNSDSVYKTLNMLINSKHEIAQYVPRILQLNERSTLPNQNSQNQSLVYQQQLQQRVDKLNKLIKPLSYYKYVEKQEVLDINTREVFDLIFSDKSIEYKNEKYTSAMQCYLNLAEVVDIKVDKWNNQPPEIYNNMFSQNIKDFINFDDFVTKKRKFVFERNTKIPMIGKIKAQVETYDKCYFISDKEFVIDFTSQASGAPYSDNFKMAITYRVKQLENNKVEFLQGLNIEWLKSPYIKNQIEKGAKAMNDRQFNLLLNFLEERSSVYLFNKPKLLQEYKAQQQQQQLSQSYSSPSDLKQPELKTTQSYSSFSQFNNHGSFRSQVQYLQKTSSVQTPNTQNNEGINQSISKEIKNLKEQITDLNQQVTKLNKIVILLLLIILFFNIIIIFK